MVNGKVAATLCVLGVFGSLFIGYCIYFDRKRRSQPDYKKKVLERKRSELPKSLLIEYCIQSALVFAYRKKESKGSSLRKGELE